MMDHLEACAEGVCQSRLTCKSILWMYFWTLVNPLRAFFIIGFCDRLMATSQSVFLRVAVLVVIPLEAERESWDKLFLPGISLWLAPKPPLSFAGVLRGSALLWELISLSFLGWNSSWEWRFLWVSGLQTFFFIIIIMLPSLPKPFLSMHLSCVCVYKLQTRVAAILVFPPAALWIISIL